MQAIAKKHGVSKVTVSKALNGQPGVSEELRQKIVETAKTDGYTLKEKNTDHSLQKVGVLIPQRFFFDYELYYHQIYYALLNESEKRGVELVLSVLSNQDEQLEILPYNIEKGNHDVLLLCGEVSDDYYNFLSGLDLKILCIDFYKLSKNADCVIIGNYFAGYLITSYLISKGHSSIGYIGSKHSTSSNSDRYYGYLKALGKNGLEYRDEWYIPVDNAANPSDIDYSLPEKLPTALVCHNDHVGFEVIRILSNRGIKVGEEISVTGFDNLQHSELSIPPLTTMNINREEIAGNTMELLFWRINNPDLPPRKIILDTTLIERESVADLNTGKR